MAEEKVLPWKEYPDVRISINEYIHLSTVNRGVSRLLENDHYLLDLVLELSAKVADYHPE